MTDESTTISNGVLSVAIPAGWEIFRDDVYWSDGFFNEDKAAATAHVTGIDDPYRRPRVYLGDRDWGAAEDLGELILRAEQDDMCLPDDFFQLTWEDADIDGLRGRRFRIELDFEPIPPVQILEVLVITTTVNSEYLIGNPTVERITALVTRCPADDPDNLARVASIWASLKPQSADNPT